MANTSHASSSRRQPGAPALPQNVEAEAALLGALMIDNRLAEDIQLKLRPDHFFEPLHGRIYEQILQLLDRNMIASPVTLRPLVRGGRGDEGAGRPGLSRPADRQRRGDHRRARLRRADLRPRPAARAGRRRPRDGRAARSTPARRSSPRARSRRPRRRSTGSPRKAAARAAVKTFAAGDPDGRPDGREGAQHRRRPLRHHHRPRDGQRQDRRPAQFSDLLILAGRPGMGKTALATNIAFNTARRYVRDLEDGIAPEKSAGAGGRLLQPRNVGRPARHPYPRRAVRDQLRSSAHGQDQPAGFPQPRPRRGRAREPAALHRRHARPHHRRAAHPRPPAEAPAAASA